MMKDLENKEIREIKKLEKDFRGMKKRFQTQYQKEFKFASLLFQSNLYQAYTINDINLNELVVKSYHEVVSVLSERLANENEKLKPEIFETLFVFRALMNEFWLQAGRNYD